MEVQCATVLRQVKFDFVRVSTIGLPFFVGCFEAGILIELMWSRYQHWPFTRELFHHFDRPKAITKIMVSYSLSWRQKNRKFSGRNHLSRTKMWPRSAP